MEAKLSQRKSARLKSEQKSKPNLSVSCTDALAYQFKRICFDENIRQSKPVVDFMEHFVSTRGNVNFKKDFIKEAKEVEATH